MGSFFFAFPVGEMAKNVLPVSVLEIDG